MRLATLMLATALSALAMLVCVGLIVRVNQHTATLDCDGQKWRVAFELLRHLVDV